MSDESTSCSKSLTSCLLFGNCEFCISTSEVLSVLADLATDLESHTVAAAVCWIFSPREEQHISIQNMVTKQILPASDSLLLEAEREMGTKLRFRGF